MIKFFTMVFRILWVVLLFGAVSAFEVSYETFEKSQKVMNPLNLWKLAGDSEKSQCQLDFQQALKDIKEEKAMYALQMLDATAKSLDGLLVGNHMFFGQFYECLDVMKPDGQFWGKYFLLGLGSQSALGSGFSFGFCAPSSCTADNLNKFFTSNNISIFASDDNAYTAYDGINLRALDWFAISVLIILGVAAGASTLYDIWQRKKGNEKPHPILTSFSLYKNCKTLLTVQSYGDGQMECLNGIRVLSMFWVIFGHSAALMLGGPVSNLYDAVQDMYKSNYVFTTNAYLSVDTFFFLGGLLVAFVFFREIGKTGSYDAPRSYIIRYLRVTPAYAMIIFMEVTLFRYIATGPLKGGLEAYFVKPCEDNWWTGLLYVQNLVNPGNMCLIQSWYLSVDMQLYLLAPLALYPLYLWPKYGSIAVSVVTVASSFWSWGIGIIYGLSYSPFLDTSGNEDAVDNFVPWTRVSPWLVGILLGYIICGLKAKKIEVKLKPIYVICGWVISCSLLAASFFGMIWFLDNPTEVTVLKSAAFLSFHRFGWALGLAWVVFACIHGYAGPINDFLSWGFFQVLGKMSFTVYLVHLTVIASWVISFTTTLHSNYETIFLFFTVVTVFSHLSAIPLSLLVELPISHFDRYYLRRMKIFPYPKRRPEARKDEAPRSPAVNPESAGKDMEEIVQNKRSIP